MTGTSPYRFCLLGRPCLPSLPIVMTAGQEGQITSAERRWGLCLGAINLLPAIQESTSIATTVSHRTCILELLLRYPFTKGPCGKSKLPLEVARS